ncbi:2489_t:CDS:2 [Diversispora eburnea]|uniref:2489_t:CDS:1 n=1 Tax=Diversispora eburnea TaxID=1213867 RepID=A0A9N9ALA3_9GLOM|nr:2489_t:CDS:2 [Diversispora eburnea]
MSLDSEYDSEQENITNKLCIKEESTYLFSVYLVNFELSSKKQKTNNSIPSKIKYS